MEIDVLVSARWRPRASDDVDDASTVDHDRPWLEKPVGQDDSGARKQNHER
jgi:hypothetical protein